jgi:hypothetical protein
MVVPLGGYLRASDAERRDPSTYTPPTSGGM